LGFEKKMPKQKADKNQTQSLPVQALNVPVKGYEEFLRVLKAHIRSAQTKAILSVNRELTLLYWQIGRDILRHQKEEGWGAKVIDRLAVDLRHAFPKMQGFSSRNLKYMRAFSEAYPEEQFVQQLAAQYSC
jgi:predicted nuclease of restriction endonuclease-like (RecB) superfamily